MLISPGVRPVKRTELASRVFLANASAASAQHGAGGASRATRTLEPSASSTVRPSITSRTTVSTFWGGTTSLMSVGGFRYDGLDGGGAAGSAVHAPVSSTNITSKWLRATVTPDYLTEEAVQRWFAPEVAWYKPILAPSSRDSPTTSSSAPVAALTKVQLSSPVEDRIHLAAGLSLEISVALPSTAAIR